jgi:cytochrome c-type biogenesis protein CcmH/NrfG
VRLDPSDALSWRNLGWAMVLLGRDADAVGAFDEALKRAPADRLAKRARGIARLHSGDLKAGMDDVAASGWLPR